MVANNNHVVYLLAVPLKTGLVYDFHKPQACVSERASKRERARGGGGGGGGGGG